MGLQAVDNLVAELARISAQPVPARLGRQRAQLLDAMLDAHFMLGLSRFVLAADADLLVGFSELSYTLHSGFRFSPGVRSLGFGLKSDLQD